MRRIVVGAGLFFIALSLFAPGTIAIAQDGFPGFPPGFGPMPFDNPLDPFGSGLGDEPADRRNFDPLADETPDADEVERRAKLREQLAKLVEEKAELLNSAALEAEIAMQQRQLRELKALRELQKVQRDLEELGDKYPDSDTGRRVDQLLKQLRRNPGPTHFPPPGSSSFPPPGNSSPFMPLPYWFRGNVGPGQDASGDRNPRVPAPEPKVRSDVDAAPSSRGPRI